MLGLVFCLFLVFSCLFFVFGFFVWLFFVCLFDFCFCLFVFNFCVVVVFPLSAIFRLTFGTVPVSYSKPSA